MEGRKFFGKRENLHDAETFFPRMNLSAPRYRAERMMN
jgi:hypothetical protein